MDDDLPRRSAGDPVPGPPTSRKGGYWIEPPSVTAAPATEPRGPVPSGSMAAERGLTRPGEPESLTRPGRKPVSARAGTRAGRERASRKRRLVRLAVLLVVLAGIVIAVTLTLTGRTVVPVVSANLFPIHYQDEIASVAERYGLDPYLVAAVAKTESGFDPVAVSPVGAVGLMQLMPATADWIVTLGIWQGGDHPDLTDPADSLELGGCYLAYLVERFGEDSYIAVLAAYNAGPNAVAAWVEAAGGLEKFESSDIAFPETRTFVERVERYRFLFNRIHPDVFARADSGAEAGADDDAKAKDRM